MVVRSGNKMKVDIARLVKSLPSKNAFNTFIIEAIKNSIEANASKIDININYLLH